MLHRLKYGPDVLILSECWLSKSPNVPSLPGFVSHKTDFSNQNEGVVAYIRKDLECKVELPDFKDANCIIIKFKHLAVIALYRSPSYKDLTHFFKSLDEALFSLKTFKSVLIIGDLNINIISSKVNHSVDEYLTLIASHGLLPGHLYPTREKSCLDHAVIRSPYNSSTLVFDCPFTDHHPVLFCYNNKKDINYMSNRTQRAYKFLSDCL